MRKNLSISSFKKLPGGFLGALLLIIVFEISNVIFDDYLYVRNEEGVITELQIKLKNEIAQSEDMTFDVLILGDSYSRRGIIPRVIEENTGLSCFNFSTNYPYGAFFAYCILRNYLEHHTSKPRYLILCYTLGSYAVDSPDRAFLYSTTKGNVATFTQEFGMLQGLKFLVPSLRHQPFLKRMIKGPSAASRASNRNVIDKTKAYVRTNQGFTPTIEESYRAGEEDTGKRYTFTISPSSYRYLTNTLTLAHQHGIPTIYLFPTAPKTFYALLKTQEVVAEHEAFARSLKEQYPDLLLLNLQEALNENSLYADRWHLNEDGRKKLNQLLSKTLNALQDIKRKDNAASKTGMGY